MSNRGLKEPDSAGDPRVFLAIERTYLAWTRTALALMAFGFVVARLGLYFREAAAMQGVPMSASSAEHSTTSLWWGTALVVLGVIVQAMAMAERRQALKRFADGLSLSPARWSLARLLGLGLIAIGIAVATYLVALL
jgi:putative membrane protein